MHYVTGFFVALLIIVVAVFAIQNLETTEVSFLFWSMSLSKVVLIIGTYLIGMLSGWGVVELVKRLLN